MGEHAVIADRGAKATQSDAEQSHADNLEAWHGKEDETDDCKTMNEDKISEDAFLAMNGLPEGTIPGALLLRYGQFHMSPAVCLVECASAWCAEHDRHLLQYHFPGLGAGKLYKSEHKK
jgi:hypothetical protein